jgi:hypothetical protein
MAGLILHYAVTSQALTIHKLEAERMFAEMARTCTEVTTTAHASTNLSTPGRRCATTHRRQYAFLPAGAAEGLVGENTTRRALAKMAKLFANMHTTCQRFAANL